MVASSGSTLCLVHEVMKTSKKYKDMTDDARVDAAKAMYFLYMLIVCVTA